MGIIWIQLVDWILRQNRGSRVWTASCPDTPQGSLHDIPKKDTAFLLGKLAPLSGKSWRNSCLSGKQLGTLLDLGKSQAEDWLESLSTGYLSPTINPSLIGYTRKFKLLPICLLLVIIIQSLSFTGHWGFHNGCPFQYLTLTHLLLPEHAPIVCEMTSAFSPNATIATSVYLRNPALSFWRHFLRNFTPALQQCTYLRHLC